MRSSSWKLLLSHALVLILGGMIGAGDSCVESRPDAAPFPCPTLAPGYDHDSEALAAIDAAKSSITLTCPRLYSVPIASALVRASERGVNVTATMEAAWQAVDPLEMAGVLRDSGAEVSLVPIRLEDRRVITVDGKWSLIDGHPGVPR
jgi:hypothetical protein